MRSSVSKQIGACLFAVVLTALTPCSAQSAEESGRASPLTLGEVMSSVERHFPAMTAAARHVDASRERARAAQGSFDVVAKAKASSVVGGKYNETVAGVQLEQDTGFGGARWSAGYENGNDFPVYAAKSETNQYGEWFASLSQPLLRGRATDRARRDLSLAEIGAQAAGESRSLRGLQVRLAAVAAYLNWVSAGAQKLIAKRLVSIAEQRQAGVELQIERGALPALEAVDNRRLIAARREKLVLADQRLGQAALELGLYRRDFGGRPQTPTAGELPDGFPADLESRLATSDTAPRLSLARRPDLALLGYAVSRLERKLAYWDNQALPSLTAAARVSGGLGERRSYAPFAQTQSETRVGLQLELSLPVQRREALGEAAALRQEIAAKRAELQLARDRAAVGLAQSWLGVTGARQRAALAAEAALAARELDAAERERFAEGLTNILTVNLREAASADAEARLVEARHDYFSALARYRAAAMDL